MNQKENSKVRYNLTSQYTTKKIHKILIKKLDDYKWIRWKKSINWRKLLSNWKRRLALSKLETY